MARAHKDWLNAYLQFTDDTEPPLVYREWVALSAIASALQRKCWLEVGANTFYPNCFIVLVGPPGKCRKGTAIEPIRSLLTEVGIRCGADATTREALIDAMRDQESQVSFTETEMAIHCSMTLHSREFAVLLGHNNPDLIAALTDWFDCHDVWRYKTKKDGDQQMNGVWLNMLAATTPDFVRKQLAPGAIAGGLTSRIIFVYADKKGKRCVFPKCDKRLYTTLMEDLGQISTLKGGYRYTENFISSYAKWYMIADDNPPFNDAVLSGYVERRPAHLLRLSMLLCASRTDNMVLSSSDFARAVSILTRTEKRLPRVFAGVGRNELSDVLYDVLDDVINYRRVAMQDIFRKYVFECDADSMGRIVSYLVQCGYVKQVMEGNGSFLEALVDHDSVGTLATFNNNRKQGEVTDADQT